MLGDEIDMFSPHGGERAKHAGNQAGSRRGNIGMPDFGPGHLYEEINSAEKLAKELDRQLRGNSSKGMVRRTDAMDGSLSRDSSIISQAAMGEEESASMLIRCSSQIMDLTQGLAERSSIRSGTTLFNVSNDSTPLTHSHTRVLNVAVIDRKTEGSNSLHEDDARQFQVQEATILPQRTGISLLMFDLCCAKPRVRRPRKSADSVDGMDAGSFSNRKCVESSITVLDRVRRGRSGGGWDPDMDPHLSTDAAATRSYSRGRSVELSSVRSGGWT